MLVETKEAASAVCDSPTLPVSLCCLQFIVECHGNTLLPQFLGMYRLTVDGVETYMVVTRNVFSHRLTVHRKYDLKVGDGALHTHVCPVELRCTFLHRPHLYMKQGHNKRFICLHHL